MILKLSMLHVPTMHVGAVIISGALVLRALLGKVSALPLVRFNILRGKLACKRFCSKLHFQFEQLHRE